MHTSPWEVWFCVGERLGNLSGKKTWMSHLQLFFIFVLVRRIFGILVWSIKTKRTTMKQHPCWTRPKGKHWRHCLVLFAGALHHLSQQIFYISKKNKIQGLFEGFWGEVCFVFGFCIGCFAFENRWIWWDAIAEHVIWIMHHASRVHFFRLP